MKGNKNLTDFSKVLNHSTMRFIVIGVINTLHSNSWFFVFFNLLKLQYQIAYTLAFIMAMIGSFFLNSYYTFKVKPTLKKFLQFPLTTLPNFIISQFGLKLLVAYLGIQENLAAFLAQLVAIPLTYLVTKYVLTQEDKDKGIDKKENIKVSSTLKEDKRKSEAQEEELLKNTEGKVIYNYGTLSKKDKWLNKWDILFILALILFTMAIHYPIFKSGKLYGVKRTDSTTQMIYFLPMVIKDFLLKGQFWNWSYGMGGDVFSEFSYYYSTSPFIWSLLPVFKLLPENFFNLVNSLNLKLYLSIYKHFLIMFFMYILLRYEKRSKLSSYAGAIVFGGGLYYMWNSNYFDFMTDAYLWVPLMVLGMRIFQKTRNYWPLLISAALSVINNYYFGFHTFNFFVLFVTVMIIPQGRKLKDKVINYFKQLGQYSLIGLGALLLSMFAFLPAVFAFLKLDRFSNVNPTGFLSGPSFYKELPMNLFFSGTTLGITMLIILFLFINYRKTYTLTDRKILLMILFFFLYCTPFTGYFLNGMNYTSDRWFYLLLFVAGYALADVLDEMKRKNYFKFPVSFILIASLSLILYFNWEKIKELKHFKIHQLVILMYLIGFLLVAIRNIIKNNSLRKILDYLVVVTIFITMTANNFYQDKENVLDMTEGTLVSQEMKSPELDDVMSKVIPTDKEFFRTVFRDTYYENTPNYYKYYGISTFASMTDGNMHDWIKRILNIRHDIVYLSSFKNMDDRMYLEGLLGVKYIIADAGKYNPVPMYTKLYSNSKYDLFVNKNTVGMDMWFTQVFDEADIESLMIPDRDIALLNYAVIPLSYDKGGQITGDYKDFTKGPAIVSEEIPLNSETMVLTEVDHVKGDLLDENYLSYYNLEENRLPVPEQNPSNILDFKNNSNVTFNIPNPYLESQIYFHTYIRPMNTKEFQQTVNNKRSFKSYESNPYVYYINDFTFTLNGNEPEIMWKNSHKPFIYQNMYLKRVNLTDFNDIITQRNKYNMENLLVEKDRISGTVNNKEKGIMVFNIPFNEGWTLKVNGRKVPLVRMNGFLSGAILEPGENNLVFSFRSKGLLLGSIISLTTLAIALALHFYLKKRHPFVVNTKVGLLQTFNYMDLYQNSENSSKKSATNYNIEKDDENKITASSDKDMLKKFNILAATESSEDLTLNDNIPKNSTPLISINKDDYSNRDGRQKDN